ncbi:hypothetical protein D3A96_07710 [Robertkochia marina]|nr:hypothetical protein D3A96_07710 [Robertkochia marina]
MVKSFTAPGFFCLDGMVPSSHIELILPTNLNSPLNMFIKCGSPPWSGRGGSRQSLETGWVDSGYLHIQPLPLLLAARVPSPDQGKEPINNIIYNGHPLQIRNPKFKDFHRKALRKIREITTSRTASAPAGPFTKNSHWLFY